MLLLSSPSLLEYKANDECYAFYEIGVNNLFYIFSNFNPIFIISANNNYYIYIV
jgi:hypothetical protein